MRPLAAPCPTIALSRVHTGVLAPAACSKAVGVRVATSDPAPQPPCAGVPCAVHAAQGAFIVFDKAMKPKFHKFVAVEHPPIKPMAYAPGMGGMFGF